MFIADENPLSEPVQFNCDIENGYGLVYGAVERRINVSSDELPLLNERLIKINEKKLESDN